MFCVLNKYRLAVDSALCSRLREEGLNNNKPHNEEEMQREIVIPMTSHNL